MIGTEALYTKAAPFFAKLKERFLLSLPGSSKETWHIILDIAGSGLGYKVGDSIAILPSHDPLLIEKTLQSLHLTGDEKITCKRTARSFSLRDYFTNHVSITRIPRDFEAAEGYELWDYLLDHPKTLSAQEIADLLPPLLPRFYSIASAQEASANEIHLTVAITSYTSRGHLRLGVGTHFLCHMEPATVPIYLQSSKDFTVPHQEADLIMVGPGTGVAPFRGFMQKRLVENHSGRNWLFFGEQKRSTDFLYEDFWMDLSSKRLLQLSLAFSRDQEEKIYVQHRMMEEASELWKWLEKGSYFFVCGDASRMAKDVEATLLQIAQNEAGFDLEKARLFLKDLRKTGRYLRDIY
ncbi:MAG: sulfite reductase [Chlamydiota bacterium]